jgi:hypothetical protein
MARCIVRDAALLRHMSDEAHVAVTHDTEDGLDA